MLKKWQLIDKKDVSPSAWFPLEKRTYELPDGRVVDDFYVTTIANVAMIVPITADSKVVMVKIYKQGVDEIMTQFPAGRMEKDHKDMLDTAVVELEEETGIRVSKKDLVSLGKMSGFSTKATEVVYSFLVKDVEINSEQNLDEFEEIEVKIYTPEEVDEMIEDGTIWCAQSISLWYLVKNKGIV